MVKYFIAAHGRMASGIKESLNVLLGASDQVDVFDAYVDDSNVEMEIQKRVEAVDRNDYLVMMSDICGGSVNQIMMRCMDREKTFLVSGISLALVVGLVTTYTESIDEKQIEDVIAQSRDMMFLIKDEAEKEEEGFF